MRNVLRLVAGTIVLAGITGVVATYPDVRTYVSLEQPRTVPLWTWCLLIAAAAGAFLWASRQATAISSQVRAASGTALVISAVAVAYSGEVTRIWVQLILKFN
jgi:hypothetical protein